MRTRSRTLLCVLVSACASSGWSTLAAQSPPVTACALLSREQITHLMAGQDPGPSQAGGSGPSTTCYWDSRSPKTSLVLHPGADPHEPRGAAMQAMLARGKHARPVSGLGDDAFFVADTGSTPSGTLYVRVGHYRLSLWREAAPTATADSALPALVALAKAAIPRLR